MANHLFLLTIKTCQPYQIMSFCKFKFRKHHKDLIGAYYDEKNRFNIAKLVRSRPSELRSTNSTEYQIKFFCKFKFRKHRENLKEINKYHIMMRYEEKNRFKDRLTRLKRLAYCRSHWMPLVVNRVRGVVTRSLVLCSFKSDCFSVPQHVQL